MVGFPILGQSLAIELANTLFTRGGETVDGLGSTAGLEEWLDAIGDRLPERPRATAALRRDLVSLRGAVRDVLRAAAEQRAPGRATLKAITACSQSSPIWLELAWSEEELAAVPHREGPRASALCGELADSLIHVVTGPEAPNLRACPAPGCVGFFLQEHGRREFCSTACATRARVARHYQRRRGSSSTS